MFLFWIQICTKTPFVRAAYLHRNHTDISIWGKVMNKSGNIWKYLVTIWFVLLFCNRVRQMNIYGAHTKTLKYHSTCLKPIKKQFLIKIKVQSITYVRKATYLYKNDIDISIWGKVMNKSGNIWKYLVTIWFVLLFCNRVRQMNIQVLIIGNKCLNIVKKSKK